MSQSITWEQISTQARTKPLRPGRQTVRITNIRRYVNPRSGNLCVGFDLVNEWGERDPRSLSLEPQHRAFLDQFVGRFLQQDPAEFDPDNIEALEGEEFEIEVKEDESGKMWIEPVWN